MRFPQIAAEASFAEINLDAVSQYFGVGAGALSDVANRAYAEAARSVKFGTPRDFGTRWSQNVREGVHELLLPAGYERICRDGIFRNVSAERRIVVIAAMGNDATGVPSLGAELRTASQKSGQVMQGIGMSETGQLTFGTEFPNAGFPVHPFDGTAEGFELWFLLYNEMGGTVYVELSRATRLQTNGYPGPWGPRIILPSRVSGFEGTHAVDLDQTR